MKQGKKFKAGGVISHRMRKIIKQLIEGYKKEALAVLKEWEPASETEER